MSLFTKPVAEISFQDVVSFCQQGIGEGVNLDYKKDFPASGLEKTISAFANTFGGVILIGIEDEDSKPKPPFEGIEYKDRLEERVWNIIVDNIYPPVFPEIRVCAPHNNKTFVIIRVPQSNETPHAIYNNTQVYVRTGNRNKPEGLATVEQTEWLRNRRKKSEELREMLYRRAEERYEIICEQKKVGIEFGEFTLSFVPLYPQKPLFKVEEIKGIVRGMEIRVANREFPWLPSGHLEPIQDGMIFFFLDEKNGLITHTEINKFGLIYYKEDMGWTEKKVSGGTAGEEEKKIFTIAVIEDLEMSFEAIRKFYNLVGYWGLVEVRFSLSGLLGIQLVPILPKDSLIFRLRKKINESEKRLSWQTIISSFELNDALARQKKLIELGKDVAWSFGFEIGEDLIKQKLKERGRWVE